MPTVSRLTQDASVSAPQGYCAEAPGNGAGWGWNGQWRFAWRYGLQRQVRRRG